MIQAQELRIGNKALNADGRVITIHSIAEYGVNVPPTHNGGACAWTFEQLDPIPLTPEILEKAGGVNNGLAYVFLPGNSKATILIGEIPRDLTYDPVRFNVSISADRYFMGIRMGLRIVQYVHDFQNLYYALTGEELPITL